MEKQLLYFEYHPLWLLLCALLGGVFAIALYYKNKNWTQKQRWILGTLRTLLIFLIAALLLNPKSIFTESIEENPILYFLVDNSLSVTSHLDSNAYTSLLNKITATANSLEKKKIDVPVIGLDGKVVSPGSMPLLAYTDLDQALKNVKEETRGRNIQGVVLVSDGVYNRGSIPGQFKYKFPVFTLGIGDTTSIPDIKIDELNYNKVVYEGNSFELQVSIKSEYLSRAAKVPVSVSKNGLIITQKNILLSEGNQYQRVQFIVKGEASGLSEFNVEIGRVENEKIIENNSSSIYVEFVKSKEKVLIVAASPHPDINAIRSALEEKEQLEVEIAIYGIHSLPNESTYDLIIFHQLPIISGQAKDWIENLEKETQAVWYITGTPSQYNILFDKDLPAKVRLKSLTPDQVKAELDFNFKSFGINEDFKERIGSYPPLAVPFGEYTISTTGKNIIKQKVGSSSTERPLLCISETYPRKAIWYGEGLWTWRIQEGKEFGNSKGFDGFIQQMVQFLSSKEDKRQLRIITENKEYFNGEPVQLISEVYDELLNPSYGHDINLSLKNISKNKISNYSFEHNAIQKGILLENLPAGIYEFEANTMLNEVQVSAKGGFVIKDQQMEFSSTTANHVLLRELADRQNGKFFHENKWDSMDSLLQNIQFPSLLHSQDTEKNWIHNGWLLALILTLACSEWTLRKYWGRT